MNEKAKKTWENILSYIKERINNQSFNTWFRSSQGVELKDDVLLVEFPNGFFIDWIQEHYYNILEEAVQQLNGNKLRLAFKALKQQGDRPRIKKKRIILSHNGTRLQERFSFESFVVGKNNEFAHAAALAVAEAPGEAYNPLFLYGGVGLGKTHLMQAIGNFIYRHKNLKVYYTQAENIMTELIEAIQRNQQMEYKRKYRTKDVLLIDDIQFLYGKERLQEEIFHTFNYLYSQGKQVVITSDRPPKEILTLEERLTSRFQGGLVVDLQPPDLETRIAILQKKAETDNIKLPPNVAYYIASRVKSNIRELEGCLIRLLALSSLSGQEVTEQLAEEVLKDLLGSRCKISKQMILKTVIDEFGFSEAELKSKKRTQKLALARQTSMYLIRTLLNLSLTEIGEFFGGKDHSTVIHAIEKIEKLKKSNIEYFQRLERITSKITG
ncbi:MAG TPA: chromosomal replication initiator protein DnaA [candidate division WOR-3 bacterium]|uniref:Chromosomal replication initiator protein DnaA n=1 Tax=candidate division WOR-3 bacterium TaxID=2052148 RepID=A0A9C9EML2_UNCW3|nr:chromosomal replication initiator protein DnaA [candidate division WOR-3 bacterium]